MNRYVGADYTTVEAVKRHLSNSYEGIADDAFLAELIREASDTFAMNTGRTYVPFTESATVVPDAFSGCDLDIPDFLSITGVTDDGTAVEVTDYVAEPRNNAPKTRLRRISGYWTTGEDIVITGTAGYHPEPLRMWRALSVTLGAALSDTTGTTVTLSISTTSGGIETLDYIRIDDEVMHVTAITLGTNPTKTTLTVERGALLTTAATHLIAAEIEQFHQYEAVKRAVTLRAAHLYRTRANPGGEQTSGTGVGTFVTMPKEPPIVAQTEARLRRLRIKGIAAR
jgi:hypothetical protein